MTQHVVRFNLKTLSRDETRKAIIDLFKAEVAGTGKGELTSKYDYVVEDLGELSVVLRRPAYLNHGFDFQVAVPGLFFDRDSKNPMVQGRLHPIPSHADLLFYLTDLKNRFPNLYPTVREELRHAFDFSSITIPEGMPTQNDATGKPFSSTIWILVARWLFIEQDITYWNYSGRWALYDALKTWQLI
jgi:hypothetical protein